jgi:hypothetical protein
MNEIGLMSSQSECETREINDLDFSENFLNSEDFEEQV